MDLASVVAAVGQRKGPETLRCTSDIHDAKVWTDNYTDITGAIWQRLTGN